MIQRELGRQILHILVGSITVFFIYIGLFDPLVLFMLLVVGILVSFLSKYGKVPVFYWFLKRFERPSQMKKFPGMGMIYFCLVAIIVLKVFPKDIALASLMVLTLGDSVSHIIGCCFGKTQTLLNKKKLLEGSIAGALVGVIGALIFVNFYQALAGAIFAMIAEASQFDLNKKAVDDNLLVPLVAGTAMLAVREKWVWLTINFLVSSWPF